MFRLMMCISVLQMLYACLVLLITVPTALHSSLDMVHLVMELSDAMVFVRVQLLPNSAFCQETPQSLSSIHARTVRMAIQNDPTTHK